MATSARTAALEIGGAAVPKDHKRKVTTIPVNLVGELYEARIPKTAVAIKFARVARETEGLGGSAQGLAMLDAINEYLVKVFGEEIADKIHERMDDEDDALDIHHLSELINALSEYAASGNPTMSERDS